jgi:pimeloyl-ACP methyl ester carboxylesterase
MKNNIILLSILCFGFTGLPAQDTSKMVNMGEIAEEDKLVKAGPDDIYVHIKGTGSSVVFVAGLGEDHKTWMQVQDNIARLAQTISYDRSGLGKSSYKIKRKDLISLTWELKETLQSAKINKPYLLVAHSLGCQISKQFAAMFPADVRGIIFIDPGFNEELLELILNDSVWQQREDQLKKYRPKIGQAIEAELKELNDNCTIADGITKLPEIPVVLFTGTKINPDFPGSKEELKVKKETHQRWLRYIPGAKQIMVPQSRHYVQNDAPELVISEIKKMLQASPSVNN